MRVRGGKMRKFIIAISILAASVMFLCSCEGLMLLSNDTSSGTSVGTSETVIDNESTGGSVLDCSKAISVCAKYDGEGWDLISGKVKAKASIPIVDIITLSATGSEYDMGCVISNTAINDKRGYLDELMFPAVSFLDPEYTYSVNKWQTACGTADAINHVLEQFFASPNSHFNDGIMISALKSLTANVKVALKAPNDYSARSELMYVCTLACNGIMANGAGISGWPMHSLSNTRFRRISISLTAQGLRLSRHAG